MSKQHLLQVAVGVIKNAEGEILVALRDKSAHQGGLWEFPGGKLEAGESPIQALVRELKEELDIAVQTASPLITIKHQYPKIAVQLHVFLVQDFTGEAKSAEGQPICWVAPAGLNRFDFPPANKPIIIAAQLPECYAILDDNDSTQLASNLQKILAKGVKLIQARLKNLAVADLECFLAEAYPLCRKHDALLLVNSAANTTAIKTDGIHLTSRDLMALEKRPEACRWLAASCHNLHELQHAQRIGVDFAVLAPVMGTLTHPGADSLGWGGFTSLVAQVNLPVYALGGMAWSDVGKARSAGGQGIAAIRAFLD